MFDDYLHRWSLVSDGDPIETHSSRLLPVRYHGEAAMLKVAMVDEEKHGNAVLAWWDGSAAARVLACDANAIVLERADSKFSLTELSCRGEDDEATQIICAVVRRLHTCKFETLPPSIPLSQWFRSLETAALNFGGIFSIAWGVSRELLADQREKVLLHGDIHHSNILHFGSRGWLAIDPKGLWGDRCFDYANLFCNPNGDIARNPFRFMHRLSIVEQIAEVERERLLKWILAWSALSAAWHIDAKTEAKSALQVAEMAVAELRRLCTTRCAVGLS